MPPPDTSVDTVPPGSVVEPVAEARVDNDQELAGLDALELAGAGRPSRVVRFWSAFWPKVTGAAILVLFWQAVVWSGWKSEVQLPSPPTVFSRFWHDLAHPNPSGDLLRAAGITMQRAAIGFLLALVIGSILGAAVSQSKFLRSAFGSLITGLQTMPSVAWFPLAILLFKITEGTILFVIVIGAAPSIANGLIGGTDHVPPLLVRAGRTMGASRIDLYRHVILPSALPSFVSGLKQGWAFSWRSLMAGELLVVVAGKPSIGFLLQANRDVSDSPGMMAVMLEILIIGVVVDAAFFGGLDRFIRRRRGLAPS